MIEKYQIARDDTLYLAWPDVALTPSGRLVCVFAECTHHGDRSYTRIMAADSTDRGRTWSPRRPITEATHGAPHYNCARITQLRDGRLAVLIDRIHARQQTSAPAPTDNLLLFSTDDGATWGPAQRTPAQGIVPDKLRELASGRWLVSCHEREPSTGVLAQRLWLSDDRGATWEGPITVASREGLNLCEVSILEVEPNTLVAFHRENSFRGWDCQKTISRDGGRTWGPVIEFPLPGCHRPVAGFLRDGRIFITYRFMQGGKGWLGNWTQNFFAAITDTASALAPARREAWTRIVPVDYDRSPKSDLGYSGWVQFDDGEIYIVNYIVDDAPKAQIRGYSLRPESLLLEAPA